MRRLIVVVSVGIALTGLWRSAYAQEYYTTEQMRSEYEQLSDGSTIYAPTASPVSSDALDAVAPGMEVKNVGGINVIVPKGTKVHKEGSQIVYEDLGEYLGRQFYELEQRMVVLEEQVQRQADELRVLHEEMQDVKSGQLDSH